MDTNCASLLTDLLLYLFEDDFIQCFIKNEKKRSRGGGYDVKRHFQQYISYVIAIRFICGGN